MTSDPLILILGSSTINKGAEAMLRTVMAELGDRLPGAQFCIGDARVRQWNAEGVVAAGVPMIEVPATGLVGRTVAWAQYVLRAPEGTDYWERRKVDFRHVQLVASRVDAAVDVSGFLFSDQRGLSGKRLIPLADALARTHKPLVYLPQAWGPFEDADVRHVTRRAVGPAALAFARDDVSREHLEALDLPTRIEQATDIAFLFKASDNGPALLAELGLDVARPVVAISPNMRVYERTSGEGENNLYARALLAVARMLEREGAQIAFVPHEFLPEGTERPDDRYLCRLLADMLGSEGAVPVLGDRSAEDLKAIIASCDLMVGSRFHALIAALSSGVPSVAVSWAHKYPALLGEFGLEDLAIDHGSLTVDALVAAVADVWNRRADIRDHIADRLPDVKRRSARAFDMTADVIRESLGG